MSPAAAGLDLEPLTEAHVRQVRTLERELFGPGAWSQQMVFEELTGRARWYVGARDRASGEIVGYAGLWFDGHDAQVMTIGTTTTRQRRGVGRLLLDALVHRADLLDADSVLLEVRVDNVPALALYERAGFTRLGLRRGYYQPENVDAYTMRLDLHEQPARDERRTRGTVLVGPAQLAAELVGAGHADAELAEHAEHGRRPLLLDVRWALGRSDGRERYREAHLPGAAYVDLDTELAAPASPGAGRHPLPDVEALRASARRWGVRTGVPVVVYDATGGMSAARAWWLLRWAGLADVRLLDGGIAGWTDAGLALDAGDVTPPPGDVVLRPGGLAVVDGDAAARLAGTGVLLDARAGERYRGEVEPVDPRAGHVPGAVSAPTAENLGPDGRFRPAAQLRERFAALGVRVGAAPQPTTGGVGSEAGAAGSDAGGTGAVGVYCGSGVTAAHEVAALASIGVDAALYPGSWSQWSHDDARPVATGAARG